MKRSIRNSVFETNSSSIHALAVQKKMPEKYGGKLKITPVEAGWEFDYYDWPNYKASYLFTALREIDFDGKYDGELRRVKRRVSELQNILYKYGVETEIDPSFWEEQHGYFENGYIDHVDQLGEFIRYIFGNENRLIGFIFGDDSYVRTGNDNQWDDEDSDLLEDEHEDGTVRVFLKGN